MLKRLAADPANGIEKFVEGREASTLGGFSDAAFIVGLKPGYKTGGSLTGAVMRTGKAGGAHGYLPGHRDMEASFFIIGPGITAGRDLGRIDMRDVAPTLAGMMGITLPAAEGRDLFPARRGIK